MFMDYEPRRHKSINTHIPACCCCCCCWRLWEMGNCPWNCRRPRPGYWILGTLGATPRLGGEVESGDTGLRDGERRRWREDNNSRQDTLSGGCCCLAAYLTGAFISLECPVQAPATATPSTLHTSHCTRDQPGACLVSSRSHEARHCIILPL